MSPQSLSSFLILILLTVVDCEDDGISTIDLTSTTEGPNLVRAIPMDIGDHNQSLGKPYSVEDQAIANGRIYNGKPVGYNFYIAFMIFNSSALAKPKTYSLICAGTLIDTSSILTAAHCAEAIKHAIEIGYACEGWQGSTDLRVFPAIASRRDILLINLHIEENYNAKKHYKNDIAVINVEQPYNSPSVGSVCFTNTQHIDYKDITLIGFGMASCKSTSYSPQLLQADGQVFCDKFCNKMAFSRRLREYQACVVVKNRPGEKPSEPSPGDAGGPIFYKDTGENFVQVGIVSVSRKKKDIKYPTCREEAYMGVYTRPEKFQSFIRKWAPSANFNC